MAFNFNFFDLISNSHLPMYMEEMRQEREQEAPGSAKRKFDEDDSNIESAKDPRSNPEETKQKMIRLIIQKQHDQFMEVLPQADQATIKHCFSIATSSDPSIAIGILQKAPNSLNPQEIGRSLVLTCSNRDIKPELISELLKFPVSELHLKLSLEALINQNASLDLINIILGKISETSSLKNALKTSINNNNTDIVSSIVSSPLCDNNLKIEALNHTILKRNANIFRLIFDIIRPNLSANFLHEALHSAVAFGSREVLTILLEQDILTNPRERGLLIINAIEAGLRRDPTQRSVYLATIESLLQNGPIFSSAYHTALDLAPDWVELTTILSDANLLLDPLGYSGLEQSGPVFRLSFEDVAADPIKYLTQVEKEGFPVRINLLTSDGTPERAVDAGGVRKAFVTHLMQSLQPHLSLIEAQIPLIPKPLIPSDDPSFSAQMALYSAKIEVYRKFGIFLSKLYAENNKSPDDSCLIGQLFHPEFYEILKLIINTQSEDEGLKSLAEILQNIDRSLAIVTQVILAPDDVAVKEAFASCFSFNTVTDNIAEEAKKMLLNYLEGPRALISDLTPELKSFIRANSSQALCSALQGQEATVESLLRALNLESIDASSETTDVFESQKRWLKEKIEKSDLAWRKAFIHWATGRTTLSPATRISLESTNTIALAAHTCFNSIEFPRNANSKETFLASLDDLTKDTGFSIA